MRPLSKAVKIVKVLLSVYYAYMVEYRAELMFWVLSGSFPLILMGIWNQAAQSGQFALASSISTCTNTRYENIFTFII